MAVTEQTELRRGQVRRLHAQGVRYREIARLLGLSYGHVKHLGAPATYERSQQTSREAKARRLGRCKDCGAQTHYDGKRGTSPRCSACANKLVGVASRGKGSVQRKVLAYLGSDEARFMDIRDHLGITSNHTSVTLYRLVRWGYVERVRRGWYRAVPRG